MDWLKNLLIKYHLGFLAALFSFVSFDFVFNIANALRDGVIDNTEYSHIAASSNSVEMIILIALMAVFRKKN